jgi:hypothetical protein
MKHLALQISLLTALVGCTGGSTQPAANSTDQTPGSHAAAQPAPSATASSQPTEKPPIQGTGRTPFFRFSSKLAESGIDFVQVSGNSPDKPFPAANGTGCGILDVEADGRPDVYFACGAKFPLRPNAPGPRDRLYRNQDAWHFQDITTLAGIGLPGYSCGVAVGDLNSDGFDDVCVTRYATILCWISQGDGTYLEQAADLGINSTDWGTSAAIADLNDDGLADIYVCNYGLWTWDNSAFCGDPVRNIRMFCSPTHVPPQPHVLYRNSGSGFIDASEESGIRVRHGRGQGVLVADIDADSQPDIYVANDIHPNFLFVREGTAFTEIGEISGTAFDHLGQAQAGMGLAIADVDRSGTLDLFVTNYQNEHNALYSNLGKRAFLEMGLSVVPEGSLPWVGWGTSLTDFDLDGWPDLIVTNGHTDDTLAQLGKEGDYAQPAGLWKNQSGSFVLAGPAGDYFLTPHVGRGLATADFDQDGDTDVVICHQDAAPALLCNDTPTAALLTKTLSLRLIGSHSHRGALPATLQLQTTPPQTFVLHAGGSYQSSSQPLATMVLEDTTAEKMPPLLIHWPDGSETTVDGLSPGETYTIVQTADGTQEPRLYLQP